MIPTTAGYTFPEVLLSVTLEGAYNECYSTASTVNCCRVYRRSLGNRAAWTAECSVGSYGRERWHNIIGVLLRNSCHAKDYASIHESSKAKLPTQVKSGCFPFIFWGSCFYCGVDNLSIV